MMGRRAVSLRLFVISTSALAALLIFATLLAWGAARRVDNATVARFALTLPPDTRIVAVRSSLAISPDGNVIVFAADHRGTAMLYMRRLSDPTPHPIPGTENLAEWNGFTCEFRADGAIQELVFVKDADL